MAIYYISFTLFEYFVAVPHSENIILRIFVNLTSVRSRKTLRHESGLKLNRCPVRHGSRISATAGKLK